MSHKKVNYLPVLLLPVIMLACFGIWLIRTPLVPMVSGESDTGVFDVRDFDFDNAIVWVPRTVEYVPGEMLTPEEFAQRDDIIVGKVPEETDVCTMRIHILVPDDRHYGVGGYCPNYAGRVYVNGKWMFDGGTPGYTMETEQSADDYRLFSAEPHDGAIEILIQTSAFANMDTSSGMGWFIGDYENTRIHFVRSSSIDTIVMSWYFLLALISLLLFLVLPSYRANGWLALMALTWALRTGVKNTRVLHTLFPYFEWPVSFKIEIITSVFTVILLTQILHSVFPDSLPKWLRWTLNGGTAAGILFVLLRPWYTFFGQGSVTNQILYAALGILFVFILLSLRRKLFHFSQWIVISGIALSLFAFVWDADYFQHRSLPFSLAQPTMVIFTLFMLVSTMLATMQKTVAREVELTRTVEKQERELTDARISIMLSQIQPHFLYNSLTAIMKLCDLDSAKAKMAVGDFAHYLRGNLESLNQQRLIGFGDELDHVEAYLKLEQLRFGDELRVEYDILVEDFTLPPLTLQPIVENAVQHGVSVREGGGLVRISTEAEPDIVRITVYDNGVGFHSVTDKENGHTHVGIENVRSRLSAICGGTLELQSIPGEGTTVTITIPYVEKEAEV